MQRLIECVRFWEVELNAANIKAFARKHCNLETSEETAEKILINFAVKKNNNNHHHHHYLYLVRKRV